MFTLENDALLIKTGKNPDALIVSSADDADMRGLYNFTTTEMAGIFNDMLAFLKANGLTEDIPAPVKRFADKIVGAKRIRALRSSVVATLAVKTFAAKVAPEPVIEDKPTRPAKVVAPKDQRSKAEKAEAAQKATEALPPLQPPPAPAPKAKPSAYEVTSLKAHPLPKGVQADTGVKVPFRGYKPWAVGVPWVSGPETITRIVTEAPHHPDVAARWSLYVEGMSVEAAMGAMFTYMSKHPALKAKGEKDRRNLALTWLRLDHRLGRISVSGKEAEYGSMVKPKA